ncbi:MerR family transcriptional regulator [Nocardioides mangrovicus]|uniref:MerR family transcriptional regulator n=1 Tax=Nocardioides mangrovicus TaxID=2478913 RepID=A0A3L8P2Z4_9ACTN|nr:MerR family transcriptional regulator [Nocardioides mangrovicus]RLV49786.1 MerR family transcriptional regulator [Nocardioides mangrovicus]
MRIGELSERTGASVRALRYYEEQGLLRPSRTPSGQRVYTADAVARVGLLRRLYAAGLSSQVIARVMPCVDTPSTSVTGRTLEVMHGEHDRLSEQIEQLLATRDQLTLLIEAASTHHAAELAASAA